MNDSVKVCFNTDTLSVEHLHMVEGETEVACLNVRPCTEVYPSIPIDETPDQPGHGHSGHDHCQPLSPGEVGGSRSEEDGQGQVGVGLLSQEGPV